MEQAQFPGLHQHYSVAALCDEVDALRKKVAGLETKNAKLEEVRAFAQLVADEFELSPGGDLYQFTGSTNNIDGLRDALEVARSVTPLPTPPIED
jgi:hypothetical protein